MHSHTGGQGAEDADVSQGVLLSTRPLEADLHHLQDGLVLGLDTLQVAGLGELEGNGGGGQLVVGLGLGLLLHELRQVTAVGLELAVLVVDDVGADAVQEARVVGHHDGGHVLQAGQVVLQPGNVGDVQVVGGLVQQQNLGLQQNGAGQGQLHLPATRQGAHSLLLVLLTEADAGEHGSNLLAGGASQGRVLSHVVQGGGVSLLSVDVVLNVHSLELSWGREALNLAVGNGAHEGGLSGTVGAAQTVASTLLQAQAGHVQQNLGTVGQGELAVAQVLTGLLVLNNRLTLSLDLALSQGSSSGLLSLLLASDGQVGGHDGLPLRGHPVLQVDQLAGQRGSVVESGLVHRASLGAQTLSKLASQDGLLSLLGGSQLALTTDAQQGSMGLGGNVTALRVSHLVGHLLQLRQQLGQERGSISGVLHQLGHVVNDDSRLALDGGLTLTQATHQQGHDDGQGSGLDLLHEGGGGQLVDAVHSLNWAGNAANQGGQELGDIPVAVDSKGLSQGDGGGSLDLLLGVSHAVSQTGDDL
mmetsp:Transcript_33591/g.74379  ORF Transcript_33591/g.74379 Transcript_33591/m.74379 type:complete len:529 (-) Transcript_33591:733-2319(-)